MKKIAFLFGLMVWSFFSMGQGMQTQFGKNVVQHKEFLWSYYQETNFDVYFYERGKEPARFVLENGAKLISEIEHRIDFPVSDKITFIVYNSYTDYRQSNFRIGDEMYNTGGRTTIQSNRAILYFDGNHHHLISQMKEAIARIAITEMLSGSSMQERVQSNILLNLPGWYVEGLIKFLADDWRPAHDIALKHGIISERYKKFKQLTDADKLIIGTSIWRYISEQYGEASISDIIYNTRATKNIDNGFLFVFGKTLEDILEEWYRHYHEEFSQPLTKPVTNAEELKLKRILNKGIITAWDINRTATLAAVATNEKGLARVWVVDLSTGKKKKVWQQGYRRNGLEFDYDYPVIGWSPVQDVLTIFYEDNSEPYYVQYNSATKKETEKQLISSVDRVLSFSYSPDGRNVVASAIKFCQTDIYLFDFRTQFFRPLTDDIYDDIEPRFVNQGKGIVFSSNRPDARLYKVNTSSDYRFNKSFDIFQFPDYKMASRTLKRMSYLSANQYMPDAYDDTYISYISEESGIRNRNAARLDSIFQYTQIIFKKTDTAKYRNDTLKFFTKAKTSFSYPDSFKTLPHLSGIDTLYIYKDTVYTYALTNYSPHLLSYYSRAKNNSLFELFDYEGKTHIFRKPLPLNIPSAPFIRPKQHAKKSDGKPAAEDFYTGSQYEKADTLKPKKPADSVHYFRVDFPESPIKNAWINTPKSRPVSSPKIILGRRLSQASKFAPETYYEISFLTDFVITQLDNSVINSPYIPYKSGDEGFNSNLLNGMLKIGAADLFKDYRLIVGFRLSPSILYGAEYFISFENYKDKLDKRIMFYRRGEVKNPEAMPNVLYRNTSHELRYELKYSYNETFALRGGVFGRLDKNVYLSTEQKYLTKPSEINYWTGIKTELVFDDIIPVFTNINYGMRGKIYADVFYNPFKQKSFFYTTGADIRYYIPIHREIIWANRFACATSIGQSKVIYFLGGVDDWFFPKYNHDNQVDETQNYVYKMLASNMRGFPQNTRNGNTFCTLNSEVRFPVFRYFANKPIRSVIRESFQLIAFFDAGSAWTGLLPTGQNNSYDKKIIYNTPLTITVITDRDPFVYSTGLGCRFMLFGYFLRLDYGMGIDDGEFKPGMWHFSMGLDF